MANPTLSERMYGLTAPSIAQRVTLALGLAGCVVLAWWLLFFGGAAVVGRWFSHRWSTGDFNRRAALGSALIVYFIRVLFSEFRFLKRGVGWNEVLTIVPWAFILYIVLALAGGTNPTPFRGAATAGAALFVVGSWMNSYAEHQRQVFKQRPENTGRLYTGGLFQFVRHPNYLGDLISFTGLCLMAGRWYTAVIPMLMLFGFVLVNVPALDQHLARHYGAAFEDYARKTRKLIPFLY